MSFLDHIVYCNRHDPGAYVPFQCQGATVGAVRRDRLDALAAHGAVLTVDAEGVTLSAALATAEARTKAMVGVAHALSEQGFTLRWRDEAYPVGTRFGESLFELERAAVPFFGVPARGIHVNGTVRDGAGLSMWIPRRPPDRAVSPDKLDNTVAGGQPAGLGLMENVIKESAEEASIPEALARRSRPVGTITYRMDTELGLRDDLLFVYDLDMPAEFTPVNTDGEVGDFKRMSLAEIMDLVDRTDAFKFNCNLVLIDFFIRHGLITPDHADYVALAGGLRQ